MNAIYARVSTEEQAKAGYSLIDQLKTCRERLTNAGFTYIKEYIDDGYSGEFLERPALEKLRSDIRDGFIKNIMVYDPDRLSRNLVNQLLIADEIEKASANLMFVTGDFDCSPEGRLFFSIRGAISEFEKAKIRERTLRGKKQKALSGKLTYNDKPYGYDYDHEKSMYVINEKEAKVIRYIFDIYNNGASSSRKVRSELLAKGILNRKNKPFTLSNINRILANEMYAGTKWAFKAYDKTIGIKKKKHIKRDQSEWIPIQVPVIVSHDIWEKAQINKKRNIWVSERNNKNEYLLKNILKCKACGYALVGAYHSSKGKNYFYYTCSAKANMIVCPNRKNHPVKALDELAWNAILEIAEKSGNFGNAVEDRHKDRDRKENLENHTVKLKEKQAVILRWVTDNIITIKDAELELLKIAKELKAAQQAINSLPQSKKEIVDIPLEEMLSAISFNDKRRILLSMGITVYAEKINGKIEVSLSFI